MTAHERIAIIAQETAFAASGDIFARVADLNREMAAPGFWNSWSEADSPHHAVVLRIRTLLDIAWDRDIRRDFVEELRELLDDLLTFDKDL